MEDEMTFDRRFAKRDMLYRVYRIRMRIVR
jgi:hypothetical protein